MAKKIEVDLKQIEALASKGYNAAMCFDAIGISHSKGYHDTQIKQAIKRGHSIARQKVIDDLMKRSEEDQSATSSIFLAKKLKVFEAPYTTATPKTIKEATERIATIYTDVSRGELDEEKANALVGYLNAYIKSYEVSELEERITKLEEVNNDN